MQKDNIQQDYFQELIKNMKITAQLKLDGNHFKGQFNK